MTKEKQMSTKTTQFTDLLADLPGLDKAADIESPDEAQMEMDFGRLAYSFMTDRAAGLMPYLLGFEVVEREDDGSRAVGIFGFKIGKDYYYAPAFFVNNQVRGMELLYSKRTNMFIPLKEAWINYIVNRQTIQLGESATEPRVREQFERPRFDFLSEPPIGGRLGKYASEIEDGETALGFAKAAADAWNIMRVRVASMLEKDAETQKAWAGFVGAWTKEATLEKTAEDSALIPFLQQHGGVPCVNGVLATLNSDFGFAKAALAFYPGVESLFVTEFTESLKPEKQAAKVTVITEKTDYIDGEERKRLVRDGFTIHDTRDDDDKSETYDVEYEKRFCSPEQPGLYNLLLRSGATTKVWVLSPAKETGCAESVVVETSGKNYFLAEAGAVFVRDDQLAQDSSDEKPDAYATAVSMSEMQPGKKYVLIDQNLCSTKPFTVSSVIAENDKRMRFRVNWRTYPTHRRPASGGAGRPGRRSHRNYPVEASCCNECDYIEIANHRGGLSTKGDNSLVVPSNWKALHLAEPESKNMESYEAEKVMEDLFQPGTLVDVMEALTKTANVHQLTVGCDDGLEFDMRFDEANDGPPTGYKSAMCKLVSRYGLSVSDSEAMLKEAQRSYKSRRLVKLGQMVGVSMPGATIEQSMGQDEHTGIPVQEPENDFYEGQTLSGYPHPDPTQIGFNIGGEAQVDQQAAGLAQQAAQAGQKQVFDHATIGGLAKLYDVGAVIDSYVPQLMDALDRLGRIVFLFYWKNEEFADRYGEGDLSEMEDALRSTFKGFGDLVLQLRQKAIDQEDAQDAVV
jgi:hypothetical protein